MWTIHSLGASLWKINKNRATFSHRHILHIPWSSSFCLCPINFVLYINNAVWITVVWLLGRATSIRCIVSHHYHLNNFPANFHDWIIFLPFQFNTHSMQYIFNTRSAIGFVTNMIIEFIFIEMYDMDNFSFLAYYASVCSYFQSCGEDIESITSDPSEDISCRISMKMKVVQIIELQTCLYE